ncbi:ectonucleoside triphosphate diphosphohydrolase 5 isoform X3 [Homalodisca vitripennis]|nr:ectonucleoside triphosphate diphosphohydrolase 5 isoform X3 [Homalodisca vitripennis]
MYVAGYLLLLLSTTHTTGTLDSIALTLGLHKSIYVNRTLVFVSVVSWMYVAGYLLLLLSTTHTTGTLDSIALTLGLHKSIYVNRTLVFVSVVSWMYVAGYLLLLLSTTHTTGTLDSIALTLGLHKSIYVNRTLVFVSVVSWMYVAGYLLLLLSTTHTTGTLDSIALTLGLHKSIYAVVIDAGSTGSRVLALSFHQSILDDSLKLDDELFIEQEPGLSAYAENPKMGAEKIAELVERAKGFVPQKAWSSTPMVLRATAGLRLLPEGKANALLDEVRRLFANSPFHTTENSVAIMEGSDEGLFAWVNINFLSDRLFGKASQMLAALDLGGGSTQITFPLIDEKQRNKFPSDDVHPLKMFGQQIYVYTHSYLGLGLMAARKAILSMGNPEGSTDLASECINPINKNKKFKYGGKEYTVQGPANPEILKKKRKNPDEGFDETPIVRLKECTDLAKSYLNSQNMTKPDGVLDFEITAFSYFFDRATEVGLLTDIYTGGTVLFKDIKKATKESCMDPNVERPFMCVDLVFISTLLEDGYGFRPDTKIKLVKRIEGHEVSWSLGAAFHFLQNGL